MDATLNSPRAGSLFCAVCALAAIEAPATIPAIPRFKKPGEFPLWGAMVPTSPFIRISLLVFGGLFRHNLNPTRSL
jgi:hypothetical protein